MPCGCGAFSVCTSLSESLKMYLLSLECLARRIVAGPSPSLSSWSNPLASPAPFINLSGEFLTPRRRSPVSVVHTPPADGEGPGSVLEDHGGDNT